MLQKGCPKQLPDYDQAIAEKHCLSGISVFHEPIQTGARTLPIPDSAFVERDATPYFP
jgi:hypothetical protein